MFNWMTHVLFPSSRPVSKAPKGSAAPRKPRLFWSEADHARALRLDIEAYLSNLRHRLRTEPLSVAWTHICRASSQMEMWLRWTSDDMKADSLQAARRNYVLARHFSGAPSDDSEKLLTVKRQADLRRADLAVILPKRPFTEEENRGHLDMVSMPPRWYTVGGTLDYYERNCDYEGMIAYIAREIDLLTRYPILRD